MGSLTPISVHPKYKPIRILAVKNVPFDMSLNLLAKSIYFLLYSKAEYDHDYGMRYCKLQYTDEIVSMVMEEDERRTLSEFAIRKAITSLRKGKYIRHCRFPKDNIKILQIIPWVGQGVDFLEDQG